MTQATTADRPLTASAPAFDLSVDAGQMYQLLTCALEAWSSYWTACFRARGLDDLYRANIGLAAQSLTLVGHAAAERQRVDGVVTPTLNEA